jgi:solute carrier family 25 carnitine/acylcarnitine transporter 20/29
MQKEVAWWQHWVGGTLGGILGVLVSHPLDTVKTMAQNDRQSARDGMFRTGVKAVRSGGARSLYSGMSAPLAGVPAIKAVVFGINGQAGQAMRKLQGKQPLAPLSYGELYVTSTLAAAGGCLVATPIERVKILQQTQVITSTTAVKHGQKSGSLACARGLVRAGGLPALFVGMRASLAQDLPTYPIYFCTFEWSLGQVAATTEQTPGEHPSLFTTAMCGSFAGVMMWIPAIPLDVAKTRIQADSGGLKYKSILHCSTRTASCPLYYFESYCSSPDCILCIGSYGDNPKRGTDGNVSRITAINTSSNTYGSGNLYWL